MGFLATLRRWFGGAEPARVLALDAPADERQAMASAPSASFGVEIPPEMQEAMTAGGSLARPVGRDEALQVPAALRARNLIAGTLSTLPIRFHERQSRREATPTTLLEQIDPDLPNAVTKAYTFEDMLFESVAWWRVTERNARGFPMAAQYVSTDRVHVAGAGELASIRLPTEYPYPIDGQVFIDGVPVADADVIRFDSPNPALLHNAGARAIRIALMLDRTAERYANEPMPQGLLRDVDPNQPEPTDDEIDKILDRWVSARRKRSWAYLNGIEAQALQWSPEQLQLADARQHAVLEIARASGIDPEDLGVSTTSRTYQNAESRRLALLDFTLGAYVTAFQERLSMRDIVPRGYYAKMDFAGFLRSDTLTRMQTYDVGLRVGAYTREEIRELEDRPPLTDAEAAESREGRPPLRAVASMPTEEGNAMTGTETARFSGETVQVAFDAADVSETFQVNVEKRTISGMLIPWGKVANNGMARWRFEANSLEWVDDSRVKLNLHHDSTQAIAYAMRIQPTSAGLDTTFKVARGPEGDRALSLAEDRVLDGLSAEIDMDEGSWVPDPSDRSVRLVKRAKLRGAALTAMPAFDDARVSAVAASHDNRKETTMAADTVTAQQSNQDNGEAFDFAAHMERFSQQISDSHKALTTELGGAIGDAVSAGVATALENLPAPQEGPQTVRAARFHVTREAPVYAFQGQGPSLVRDAWYAAREHDSDAKERLRKYRNQTEEMAKLAQQYTSAQFADTTTAAEIIPPGYRPDLYVPELMQGRPLVGLCSRGTIASATPFLVPKFGTATGATADHTEGTNPTEGSVTFTEETVSPGAISGRLTLTREIVDSSNPAIDQIALATMRESYNQQTESKVYTALNGTATSTVEYAEATVITDVRGLLAQYPFTRFAAPSGAAMNQKVTTAFATAEDSTGRPLLPSVGAQNASGLGNAVNQGWFIDGLTFVPAWSITDGLSDDAAVIVNRADVWVWESPLLTFRYEEKQGPANIELNVFGYFATHVLRPAGVFAVRNPAA